MPSEQILAKLWTTVEAFRHDPATQTGALVRNPYNLRNKVIQEAYELVEAHQARLARLEASSEPEEEGLTGFGTKRHMTGEGADLVYYIFVLLASIDVTPNDIYAVLERRYEKWGKAAAE